MNQISSWKCKLHNKFDVQYGCLSEQSISTFICQVCLLKEKKNFTNFISIPEIQCQEEILPIQNWPYGIEQKYIDFLNDHSTTNKQQKIHDQIEQFYKSLESLLLETIQRQKEKAISQLYSFEQGKNDMIKFYNEKFMRQQLQAIFFEQRETDIEHKFKELLKELKKTKEKDLQELYRNIDEFESFDSHISFDQPQEILIVVEQLLSKINMYSSALIQDVENTPDVTLSEDSIDISQIGNLFVRGLTKFSDLKQQLAKNLQELKQQSEIIDKKVQISITDLENSFSKERETETQSNRFIYDLQRSLLSSISTIDSSVKSLNQRFEENIEQQNATQKSLIKQQNTLLNQTKQSQIEQQNIEETQQRLAKKLDDLVKEVKEVKEVQNPEIEQENNIKKQQVPSQYIRKNSLGKIQESIQEQNEENDSNESDSSSESSNEESKESDSSDCNESDEIQSDCNQSDSNQTDFYLMLQGRKEMRIAEEQLRKEKKQEKKALREEILEEKTTEYFFKNLNLTRYDFDDYDLCQIYQVENNNIKIELESSSFSVIFTEDIRNDKSYTMRFQLSASYGDYEELQIGIASGNMKVFIKDQKKNVLRKDFYSKYQNNLKGDFHDFIKENEVKEIEMRVCVSQGKIQFSDYPDYNHVVENKRPMSQLLDYRIALSVYQYNNPDVIITHFEESDDFNSF